MQPKWDERSSRDLDSFEEFFWYMEDVAPTLHFHVVTVTGATLISEWQTAWQALHAEFPLLTFRIVKEAGKRPRFIETGRHATLEIEAMGENTTVAFEAEKALAYPFIRPEQDVICVRVNHSPNTCIVSVAAHHSFFDGMSTLSLLQDLLARVSGQRGRTTPPPWTSLRDLVGAEPRNGYRALLAEKQSTRLPEPPPPVQVQHLALGTTLTKRLEKMAHRHDTTPHGALMVALQLAGASSRPAWARHGLSCNTPHNIRGTGINADATGMLTIPLITALPRTERGSFWAAAREARNALTPLRSSNGRKAFVATIDNLTADEMTPADFLAAIAGSPIAYELMLTDYASYRPRIDYGPLRVTSIATGNNGGSPITQTVGVCTLDAVMHLTQISAEPIANLLEDCRDLLTKVCCD